jgi:uncharacterized protein (DUF2267 family)
MTQPREVLHASKLYQEWLAALKERALLQTHNQSQAMFRGVLHALRRHMTPEQVLAFADALPPLPRGIFLERWRPTGPLPLASPQQLTAEVATDLASHHAPPDTIVADVLVVLAERLERTEAEIARDQLPDVLRPLWPTR